MPVLKFEKIFSNTVVITNAPIRLNAVKTTCFQNAFPLFRLCNHSFSEKSFLYQKYIANINKKQKFVYIKYSLGTKKHDMINIISTIIGNRFAFTYFFTYVLSYKFKHNLAKFSRFRANTVRPTGFTLIFSSDKRHSRRGSRLQKVSKSAKNGGGNSKKSHFINGCLPSIKSSTSLIACSIV